MLAAIERKCRGLRQGQLSAGICKGTAADTSPWPGILNAKSPAVTLDARRGTQKSCRRQACLSLFVSEGQSGRGGPLARQSRSRGGESWARSRQWAIDDGPVAKQNSRTQ